MIRSDRLSDFPSQILGSAILPPWVDLFHQRDDSALQAKSPNIQGVGPQ
jgi:hypothetical protein